MRDFELDSVAGMRDFELDSEQGVQLLEGLERNNMILLKRINLGQGQKLEDPFSEIIQNRLQIRKSNSKFLFPMSLCHTYPLY